MNKATSFSENATYGKESNNVIESTMERRINSRLPSAIRSLDVEWTSKRGDPKKLDKYDISEEEREEIKKILNRNFKL